VRSSSFRKEFDAVEAAGVIYLSLKLSLGQPPTHGTMVSGALEAVITI